MTTLNILLHPHPTLREIAAPVLEVTDEIKKFVNDMWETLYHDNGVGLAATQVNVKQRVLVVDVSDKHNNPQCFINPEILESSGSAMAHEGCLSFPNMYLPIVRPEFCKVRALDEHGQLRVVEADGLFARCLQHEIDHLNGVVFIDHVTRMKRDRALTKYFKELKLKNNVL